MNQKDKNQINELLKNIKYKKLNKIYGLLACDLEKESRLLGFCFFFK